MRRNVLLRLVCNLLIINELITFQAFGEEQERGQENVPLTLFQIIARSDLIVRGLVQDGSGRYAKIEVREVLKGEPQGTRVRIDFRDLNLNLHGQEMMVFRPGESYVLFLARKRWRKPSRKNVDILDLVHGRRGRMLLPEEGAGIDLGAVQELVPIARSSPESQIEGLRRSLRSDNPRLREAAFDELIRLRSASEADSPYLVRLLGDPSPRIRIRSLQLIAILLAQRIEPTSPEAETATIAAVLVSARSDPEENVRVESVRALGRWPHAARLAADLRAIAAQDSSQQVRYEAQRVLFRMNESIRSGSAGGDTRPRR